MDETRIDVTKQTAEELALASEHATARPSVAGFILFS